MLRQLPDKAALEKMLRYDPNTGSIFWRERPESMFVAGKHSAAHSCAKWNSAYAGKEALRTMHSSGYRHGTLLGVNALSHRVIWKLMTGDEAIEIDHIDGNRSNNRWSNLRSVTSGINRRNAARHRDNRSGTTGVRAARGEKWSSYITVDHDMIYLGTYLTIEEAIAVRKAAEVQYKFHPNHGREPTL